MNIKRRLYDDFFRPSKEVEYEQILKSAKENGYEFHTVLSFEDVVKNGVQPDKKYLILRRDIDTADFKILRKMLALEIKYGARATYYFRWNTLNTLLMREIANGGGESSYHYEEIATYCYKHHINNKETALSKLSEIRDLFVLNIEKFRKTTGQPCLTVSSHGEYVNTLIHTANTVIMDEETRVRAGILREAYDRERMDLLTCRIADQVEMENFTPKAVAAIERGEPVLELLTHPRQWNSPFWVNLKEEISRVFRGIYMNI